jgi:hypothetical protein
MIFLGASVTDGDTLGGRPPFGDRAVGFAEIRP